MRHVLDMEQEQKLVFVMNDMYAGEYGEYIMGYSSGESLAVIYFREYYNILVIGIDNQNLCSLFHSLTVVYICAIN